MADDHPNKKAAILIVEDEDSIRELLIDMLRELVPDVVVIPSSDGVEATQILHSAEGRELKLVITDIRMPYLNGISLLKEISLMKERGETLAQTLVISGTILNEFERKRIDRSGVLSVIHKPFRVQDFAPYVLSALQVSSDEYQTTVTNAEHLESLIMLGEMSAAIVHEVRNPLTILLGIVSLVKQEIIKPHPDLSRVDSFMDRINSNTLRIAKIVDSVSTLSHQGKEGETEVFSSQDLEKHALPIIEIILKNRQIPLQVKIDPSLFVCGSMVQIIQVLTNLINNAADAVQNAPSADQWIKLLIQREDDSLILSVENGGPCIPPNLHNKIFARFFTTKPRGQGTGLGLPLCRTIAERHHGTLVLVPNVPRTRFELRIPLANEADIIYPIAE